MTLKNHGLRGSRALRSVYLFACLTLGGYAAQANHSPPPPPKLSFFKNYFVTGDYVAAGVGLKGKGVNGLAAGSINIDPAQIPAGADIVAAYLYWETTASSSGAAAALAGAQFQKNDI